MNRIYATRIFFCWSGGDESAGEGDANFDASKIPDDYPFRHQRLWAWQSPWPMVSAFPALPRTSFPGATSGAGILERV